MSRALNLVIPLLACVICNVFLAHAEEQSHGNLDFSRLTKTQEDYFWRRLQSLAIEDAVLAYCGETDEFPQKAKQGIRACVTAEALSKAEAYFRTESKSALEQLRARKALCRAKPAPNHGWLGVELNTPESGGASVAGVVKDSPAEAAEIKAGDVVTSLNGDPVASPKALTSKIRNFAPGASVTLGLTREGAARSLNVKLGGMAFDADGRPALDMPALIASSRTDLAAVADEVTGLCQKCSTTIWAMFCH